MRSTNLGASPPLLALAFGGELALGGVLVVALAAGWAGVRAFASAAHVEDAMPLGRIAPVDPEAVTERIEPLEQAAEAEGGDRLAG